jgi:hypothetical protein
MSEGGPMKLYVWQPALTDYSSGAIFVIAPDLRTARREARKGEFAESRVWQETATRPEVFDLAKMKAPRAWLIWGGG